MAHPLYNHKNIGDNNNFFPRPSDLWMYPADIAIPYLLLCGLSNCTDYYQQSILLLFLFLSLYFFLPLQLAIYASSQRVTTFSVYFHESCVTHMFRRLFANTRCLASHRLCTEQKQKQRTFNDDVDKNDWRMGAE